MIKPCALALLVASCAEKVPPQPVTELRVSLPDGWVAGGSNERLLAGPRGRKVISLESKADALPTIGALVGALTGQNLHVGEKISGSAFIAVRYATDPNEQPAFLGVKSVGSRTVWCASLHGSSALEVADALTVCSGVELK